MKENKNNSDKRDHARGSAGYTADQLHERIKGIIESLDQRMASLETGVSCLNLARDLLIDWVYHNTVINKEDQPKYPPEIDIAIKLINLVIDKLELNHDIIVDDLKEMYLIVSMVEKMGQDIERYEAEDAYLESGLPVVLEE